MTDLHRYHRQMLLPGIGETGQRRIRAAHVLVVGCGALGTAIADGLARAGVGTLTIVDRDFVEITNLQRQVLFDETDVASGLPKAEAARRKLARINHEVVVHAHVADFNHRNAARLAAGAEVIVDGLDNFETRYLLNDLAVRDGRPYVYGGAVATTGLSMTVLPWPGAGAGAGTGAGRGGAAWGASESTPCLRCVFPEAPPPGSSPTCDTAGVLGPAVTMVAAHQVAQTLKLLVGRVDAVDRGLLSLDVWTNVVQRFDVSGARNPDCECCGARTFAYLDGRAGSGATTLCGREAVQITPAADHRLDLAGIAAQLAAHGTFTVNEFLVRGVLRDERGGSGAPVELTVFPDGRAIVKGITDVDAARAVYARYVGA
ncbi:MAG: ThiF family adenylyltransferase [Phycisphaerales bacterium]|nr:ThiF family adenylyltransferase [Phycisphaerales bacterium]